MVYLGWKKEVRQIEGLKEELSWNDDKQADMPSIFYISAGFLYFNK